MYYESKNDKLKEQIMMFIFFVSVISLLIILILKLDGNNINQTELNNYETSKLSTENEQNVENNIQKHINEVVKTVVGISKLKQNGTSIFLDNSEQKLGLGSGIILSDNGYILTNQHVAGNKYSNCYVTLENGQIYDGTVVWADTNLDLAISIGLTSIETIPTSAFAAEATKTSMIVDYNYNDGNIQINSAKLRFGAILDKELFADATEYDVGVIMTPSEDMANTTYNAYLNLAKTKTIDGLKSMNTNSYTYSLKENMATVNYDEATGTTVAAEDGAYYQFAAVVNGFENHLDQSITSAVYVVIDGTLSILDEATYSISSLAARYVAEGFTGHQELLEFLKNA